MGGLVSVAIRSIEVCILIYLQNNRDKPGFSPNSTKYFYCLSEKTSVRDEFAAKTNLAVRSTKFCQCKFDERDIRGGLCDCCGLNWI